MNLRIQIYFTVLVISVSIKSTAEYGNWNPNRRPKIMGDLINMKSLDPKKLRVQRKIVLYHNFFRSNVKPSAKNMLRMKWHKDVAKAAQRWADACVFLTHDNTTGRFIDNYGSCGQNIFISSHQVPWFFAVNTWWLEKDLFKFGKPNNNLTIIGHYTQMVWASTHEIGCGIAKCLHHGNYLYTKAKVYYNYVCNYCPIGNRPGRLGRPYRRGEPCRGCQKHCKGKLCSNFCPAADQWSNCKQLHNIHPYWLCNTKTPQGKQRLAIYCSATCSCRHKVHD
ncbi:unnamed protein product [Phaedon cochleariae]|uniref:SCP domain-containing protein n=1 Tax=Phaedon cochleariae TaxID=80249 RepID=A0A9P0DZC7_PHACE|nr:unnamed protein product [Phaedon cochleariae]